MGFCLCLGLIALTARIRVIDEITGRTAIVTHPIEAAAWKSVATFLEISNCRRLMRVVRRMRQSVQSQDTRRLDMRRELKPPGQMKVSAPATYEISSWWDVISALRRSSRSRPRFERASRSRIEYAHAARNLIANFPLLLQGAERTGICPGPALFSSAIGLARLLEYGCGRPSRRRVYV